ncbi:MAG: hypothetical protein JXB50_01580 [Spirochaetes bacterium]|nr:hypothetical protein [Spirochaetota bacterium]
MKVNKLLLRSLIIIISTVLVLFIVIILLLSILFPNELVRKEIEKQAGKYLNVDIKLGKLKFSIFSGIKINDIEIGQYGKGWSNDNILNVEEINFEYRFLPLLFQRTISIKECVLKKGVVNLERNKTGTNWDYFLNLFTPQTSDKKVEKSKEKKEEFTRNIIPVGVDLKRVGIDGLTVNYTDNAFLNVRSEAVLSDLKVLAKNINIKSDKPFDLEAGTKIALNSGSYLNLNSEFKSKGRLKIFDETTGKISLSGPIDLAVVRGDFTSPNLKELVVNILKSYLSDELGPVIKYALGDIDLINKESETFFNSILDKSQDNVQSAVKKSEDLFGKKQEFMNYNNGIFSDFEKKSDGKLDVLDNKIEEIDKKITPLLDTASRLPLIDTMLNIKSYRDRTKKLKEDIEIRKSEIFKKNNDGLKKYAESIINENFPGEKLTYNSLLNDFQNKVKVYKTDIMKNAGKYSPFQFIDSLFSKLDDLNKEWHINELKTTFILGKKESQAKDLSLKLKYLESLGTLNIKDKNIDYLGNLDLLIKEFNIDFLNIDKISLKVNLNGVLPDIKYNIVEKPKIEINNDNRSAISKNILSNFLSTNYSSGSIMTELMKGVSLKDINMDKLKESMANKKDLQLNELIKETASAEKILDTDINAIIKDIKSRVPGLR